MVVFGGSSGSGGGGGGCCGCVPGTSSSRCTNVDKSSLANLTFLGERGLDRSRRFGEESFSWESIPAAMVVFRRGCLRMETSLEISFELELEFESASFGGVGGLVNEGAKLVCRRCGREEEEDDDDDGNGDEGCVRRGHGSPAAIMAAAVIMTAWSSSSSCESVSCLGDNVAMEVAVASSLSSSFSFST